MISKTHSAIPIGYNGHLIDVEGDISKSLPAFNIVGMANKTITEARERVRSAITNSGFSFPAKRVTINLSPAELTKDGTYLDLPIALSVLVLSDQLLQKDLENRLFVGELSLDGQIKPIRGVINIIEAARAANIKEVFIPQSNLSQTHLISDIDIIGVSNLKELFLHLKNVHHISQQQTAQSIPIKNTQTVYPTLDDIHGQQLAKRALSIAIAGRHNILLSGPPGAGKTLLAKAAAHLLPPPSASEQISINKIHSITSKNCDTLYTRPFRAPHHTASAASIIGGGPHASPGEISLAHHGVLFLDEFPEYRRDVIEALRQPLEDKTITISRTNQRSTFPADFILIATMNPCPCGHFGDPSHHCTCMPNQILAYHKRISGPILDRIDIIINVEKLSPQDFASFHVKNTISEKAKSKTLKNSNPSKVKNTKTDYLTHSSIKNAISNAYNIQHSRYPSTSFYNSNLSPKDISTYVKITAPATHLLQEAADKLNLSARAYFKVIKVSQTIADLSNAPEILPEHISEALSYRQQISV